MYQGVQAINSVDPPVDVRCCPPPLPPLLLLPRRRSCCCCCRPFPLLPLPLRLLPHPPLLLLRMGLHASVRLLLHPPPPSPLLLPLGVRGSGRAGGCCYPICAAAMGGSAIQLWCQLDGRPSSHCHLSCNTTHSLRLPPH